MSYSQYISLSLFFQINKKEITLTTVTTLPKYVLFSAFAFVIIAVVLAQKRGVFKRTHTQPIQSAAPVYTNVR